ncbi:MAG: dockerin type I domain-containing protein [Acutalibacteraceae bacterium]|nr:dockerin type I domain-containing protein [Acutalibacteraceae bacterium]
MKKIVSLLLTLCLLMGMVICIPFSASAITVEEADTDNTVSAYFDFETADNMKVIGQSHSSAKFKWEIDALTTLEYYGSGWGFDGRFKNPVKEATGATGSIVNSSEYAMRGYKTTYNHWYTAGGNVINRVTSKGTEPLVLEDNTTYTVEFDFLVMSAHLYGDIVSPTDATNAFSISADVENIMSFGYGCAVTPDGRGLAPINTPKTTVATFASVKPSRDGDGYFTSNGEKKEIGSWYHASYTFTTGTFESVFSTTNAPFLIFYCNKHTGADMYLDNIRVKKHVDVNFHGMGGTLDSTSVKSAVGSPMNFPVAQRYGYDLTGWYMSGDCTERYTDTVLTKELVGKNLYAGWTRDKYSFEGYTPASSGVNASVFSVSETRAYSGSKSMRYKYSKNVLEFLSNTRTPVKNYFTIRPVENGKTYRISFKYYLESGPDVVVYPVTTSTTNSNNADTYTGSQVILSSSSSGAWHTVSMVFSANVSNGNHLGLHVHANSNTNTTLYIDDLVVAEAENGSGTLTVNAGEGTTANVSSRSISLNYGDKISSDFVYFNGYALEGFYTDSSLTQRVAGDVFTSALDGKTVYAKWSNYADLTRTGLNVRSGGFATAEDENVLCYNGANGKASLVKANAGSYVVEFLYKNNGGEATVSTGSGTFDVLENENDRWYKGFVPVTLSSDGKIELSVTGETQLEIKDVYIRNLDSQVYIIFDSREYDGRVEIVYGTPSSPLEYAVNPVKDGMKFDGWYNGNIKFGSSQFPSASFTLNAKMVESGESIKGDSNGDGNVNTTDVALLKLYLAGRDVTVTMDADVSGDGKINSVDLVLLYIQVAQQ